MKGKQLTDYLESYPLGQKFSVSVIEPFADAGMYAGDDLVLLRINEVTERERLYLIRVEDEEVCFRFITKDGINLRLTALLGDSPERFVRDDKVRVFALLVLHSRTVWPA